MFFLCSSSISFVVDGIQASERVYLVLKLVLVSIRVVIFLNSVYCSYAPIPFCGSELVSPPYSSSSCLAPEAQTLQ